ncbi:MAG TPA: exosortase-associated EpsI family protein [Opitutaceae bacterium]
MVPQRERLLAWSLCLPALSLVAAASLQGFHFFNEIPRPRGPHLEQTVPTTVAGWKSRNVPLGQSELLTNEAEKVLNYDEVLNRVFTKGSETFGVYVAYWSAGKMPARLVASHTPDRCWTGNGWHCLAMKFRQSELFEGRLLQPAEWRVFESPSGGEQTYVLYWQLVEGRAYDYGGQFNAVPNPVIWWKDAMQQVAMGSREQYFIRLTSNQPVEKIWSDPGISEIVRRLEGLGLLANRPGSGGDL